MTDSEAYLHQLDALDLAESMTPKGQCTQGSRSTDEPKQQLRCLDCDDRRIHLEAIEVARKRAVLASQIAFHHFRLVSALKTAAEYASRTGNINESEELAHHHSVVAAFSRRVSSDADNAHAGWISMRGPHSPTRRSRVDVTKP